VTGPAAEFLALDMDELLLFWIENVMACTASSVFIFSVLYMLGMQGKVHACSSIYRLVH
jgi:hypothetical protein